MSLWRAALRWVEFPGRCPRILRCEEVWWTREIVLSAEVHDPRGKNHRDCHPPSGLEKGEPWVPLVGKRKKKRKKKGGTSNSNSSLPASASDVATDSANGAGAVKKDLSFAMAAQKTRNVAVSETDPRARPKPGTEIAAPAKRTVRVRARKRNSAVVMIRCDKGGPSYAEVMCEARTRVPLEELGIADTRVRRAQTGGLLVKIPGEDAGKKANSLVERFNFLLKERVGVKVMHPIRRMEFRLIDLDESITAEKIKEAVAARGKVQLCDVRVGPLRPGRDGLNSVWPEPCADLLQKDGGLRVG